MNNEIKEILDNLKEWSVEGNLYFEINDEKAKKLYNYITNLQQENHELKSKLECYENGAYYSSKVDELEQENERLKEENQNLLEEIHKATISSYEQGQQDWKELNKDYKSRCEKANNQLKIIMQIIKEQPTRNIEDDEWLENRLIGVVNILQNGSEDND